MMGVYHQGLSSCIKKAYGTNSHFTMTKTRQKRPRQYEKYQAGCMWGILSMLDFRHRSNQRFLPDKKSESMHHGGDSGNRFEVLDALDEKLPTALDQKERSAAKAVTGKPSVKKLIEEEIVGEQGHKIKKGDVKSFPKQSDKAVKDDGKKNRKRNRRSSKGSRDLEFDSLNAAEGCTVDEIFDKYNPKEIAEQICGEICQKSILNGEHDRHPYSGDLRISDIKEKLGETIREFINQQLACGKHLGEDGTILFSKELVNVLQVPNLDEESFLKLLRDPNSLLVKYMQSLQEINVEGDGISDSQPELDKSKGNDALLNDNPRSIRRNVDSQEKKGTQMRSKSSSQIIILNPGPKELGKLSTIGSLDSSSPLITQNNQKYKGSAPFSVASIKRNLKNIMGREQSSVNPDGMTKVPDQHGGDKVNVGHNSGRNSPGKEHFYLEKMAKLPSGAKRKEKFVKHDKLGSLIQCDAINDLKRREADIYLEARKHLVEMLSTIDEIKKFSSRQFPKSLGRILSLSDYNSPLSSPSTDFVHSFMTEQMRFTSKNSPQRAVGETTGSQEDENNDSQMLLSTVSAEDESMILEKRNTDIQALDTKADGLLGLNGILEIPDSYQGSVNIPETTDGAAKEFSNADTEVTISYNGLTDDQNESCTTRYDEGLIEEHDFRDRLASTPSTSPRCSSTMKKEEDFKIVVDKIERPSPVSVLDPSLMEDGVSPAELSSRAVELRLRPVQIKFADEMHTTLPHTQPKVGLDDNSLVLEYVKAVLQASRFSWNEHYLRSEYSDQLIDPSLFDGVDFLHDHLQYDQKIMFDCINEVLLEVCDDYFGCCPWVAFVKPGIRYTLNWESPFSEVREGIRWHLPPLPLPHTLDHIVRKDMVKSGNWMDLRSDAEVIGFEMGGVIFEELIEEAVVISLGFADISKTDDFN